ncbi:MAG: hypothetical protein ACTHKL_27010 [Streptosporangiaceae bacterium]
MRQLRGTAEPEQMMQWLTDAGRRQQTWQRRVEQRAGIRDPRAEQLPDGRLRWRYDWTDGRRVWRFTTEDVAATKEAIEHVYHAALAGPRAVPVRWRLNERISVKPAGNGSDVTVRVLGRMTGASRVLHVLGHRDTATTARLADMARLQADQTASAIAAHFQDGT